MARSRKTKPTITSPPSSSEDEVSDLDADEAGPAKRICSCGCRRLVSRITEWRHLKNKAEAASVPETTKAAFRNTSPAPSFPGAKRAQKRGGSLSADPRPRKRAHKSKKSNDDEQSNTGPKHPEAEHAPAAATVEPSEHEQEMDEPALDNESLYQTAQMDIDNPAERASEPTAHDAPDLLDSGDYDGDTRPDLETFERNRYRATVSDELEGMEDEDDEALSNSDSDMDDDTIDVLDDFTDDDGGPSAWDELGEDFEAHIAGLGAYSSNRTRSRAKTADRC